MRAIVFAAALLATTPALAQTPDAAPIVAAERAFAADASELGLSASFSKWSVPDAVMIGNGQVQTVRDVFPPEVPRPADEIRLEWWPNFAGISRSGDLGFTTGGVAINGRRTGHYFTIWQRQPDGSWRWVYDGGSGASAAGVPGPETEPFILPVSYRGAGSAETAMREVRGLEGRVAMVAAHSLPLAYAELWAEDGRLYLAGRPPVIGKGSLAEALPFLPEVAVFMESEGGGASDAGDLVWTYGPMIWFEGETQRTGYYVRLWQKEADDWKLVLAQTIPAPADSPVPAAAAVLQGVRPQPASPPAPTED